MNEKLRQQMKPKTTHSLTVHTHAQLHISFWILRTCVLLIIIYYKYIVVDTCAYNCTTLRVVLVNLLSLVSLSEPLENIPIRIRMFFL